MKHLNNFKTFESKEDFKEILLDCKDILLELEDDGFKVKISSGKLPQDWILVSISKKEKASIDIGDIEETIERLRGYLSKFGFKIYNSSDNYPKIEYINFRNPYDFSIKYILSKTNIQFNRNNYKKTTESKKESNSPVISDIKYDIEEILFSLIDDGFECDLHINHWTKTIPDNANFKWISVSISKEGKWDLRDIDEYIIRMVDFLSIYEIYPLFETNPDLNMETALISNHYDKFRNRLHKVPGTTDTYSYDIQFQVSSSDIM